MGIVANNTGWVEASVPSPVSRGVDRRTVMADVTLTEDYAAGGESIVLPEGIGDLRALFITPQWVGNYVLSWDGSPDDPKIMAYRMADDTDFDAIALEAPEGSDLSSYTVTLMAVFER